MSELIVMDRSGDSRTPFTQGDATQVAVAEKEFYKFLKLGYVAVEGEGDAKFVTRKFNPGASKIIMHPQYIGG